MKINFFEQKIELTKQEMKKASVLGSYDYEQLKRASKELPTFKVVIKPAGSKKKNPHRGLTYERMSEIIAAQNISLMQDFEMLKTAKTYFEVKKWFLTKLPEFYFTAA